MRCQDPASNERLSLSNDGTDSKMLDRGHDKTCTIYLRVYIPCHVERLDILWVDGALILHPVKCAGKEVDAEQGDDQKPHNLEGRRAEVQNSVILENTAAQRGHQRRGRGNQSRTHVTNLASLRILAIRKRRKTFTILMILSFPADDDLTGPSPAAMQS